MKQAVALARFRKEQARDIGNGAARLTPRMRTASILLIAVLHSVWLVACNQADLNPEREDSSVPVPVEPAPQPEPLDARVPRDTGTSEPEMGRLDAAEASVAELDSSIPDGSAGPDADPPEPEAFVRVGIPDESGLRFVPLEDGGRITTQQGGQGGTHALVAIECKGFGNRVKFKASVRNLDGEGEVSTADLPRPRPIQCDPETDVCRISPILVILGGLATPDEWDGLHVELSGTVISEDGLSLSGTARGYLTPEVK